VYTLNWVNSDSRLQGGHLEHQATSPHTHQAVTYQSLHSIAEEKGYVLELTGHGSSLNLQDIAV
jgi:hypothetical protein